MSIRQNKAKYYLANCCNKPLTPLCHVPSPALSHTWGANDPSTTPTTMASTIHSGSRRSNQERPASTAFALAGEALSAGPAKPVSPALPLQEVCSNAAAAAGRVCSGHCYDSRQHMLRRIAPTGMAGQEPAADCWIMPLALPNSSSATALAATIDPEQTVPPAQWRVCAAAATFRGSATFQNLLAQPLAHKQVALTPLLQHPSSKPDTSRVDLL